MGIHSYFYHGASTLAAISLATILYSAFISKPAITAGKTSAINRSEESSEFIEHEELDANLDEKKVDHNRQLPTDYQTNDDPDLASMDKIAQSKALANSDRSRGLDILIGMIRDDSLSDLIIINAYRALLELKADERIHEILLVIDSETNTNIKLAGMEAIAIMAVRLQNKDPAYSDLIINRLKEYSYDIDQNVADKAISLVSYLVNENSKALTLEVLSSRESYALDIKYGLTVRDGKSYTYLDQFLEDMTVLFDESIALKNQEYFKVNQAYSHIYYEGTHIAPDREMLDLFFLQIKPEDLEKTSEENLAMYRQWLSAATAGTYYNSDEFNEIILSAIDEANTSTEALVLLEYPVEIFLKADKATKDRLITLIESQLTEINDPEVLAHLSEAYHKLETP